MRQEICGGMGEGETNGEWDGLVVEGKGFKELKICDFLLKERALGKGANF